MIKCACVNPICTSQVTKITVYTTVQNYCLGLVSFFFMFLNEVTYAHQCFIYLSKNTVKTVIL